MQHLAGDLQSALDRLPTIGIDTDSDWTATVTGAGQFCLQ
jgi:hypothetical protein